MELEHAYRQAAEAILAADALLIGAGAGMGVDSGLPDFRGPEGFWRAYPAFRGQRFEEISNPVWFQRDPEQAWGFFGHRLNLYRATAPHAGFEILRRWGEEPAAGLLRLHQQRGRAFPPAGFAAERILECHGSINFPPVRGRLHGGDLVGGRHDCRLWRRPRSVPGRPCRVASTAGGWPGPTCSCSATGAGSPAAPTSSSDGIETGWGRLSGKRLALLNLGPGRACPRCGWECESRGEQLVRVNPRDTESPPGTIVLPVGALQAIQAVDRIIGSIG